MTGYLRGRRRARRLRSWISRRSDSRSSPSDSKTRLPFSALANAGSPMASLSEHAANGRDTDSGPSSKMSPAARSWGSSSVRRPWRPPRRGANPPRHSLGRLVAGASEYPMGLTVGCNSVPDFVEPVGELPVNRYNRSYQAATRAERTNRRTPGAGRGVLGPTTD